MAARQQHFRTAHLEPHTIWQPTLSPCFPALSGSDEHHGLQCHWLPQQAKPKQWTVVHGACALAGADQLQEGPVLLQASCSVQLEAARGYLPALMHFEGRQAILLADHFLHHEVGATLLDQCAQHCHAALPETCCRHGLLCHQQATQHQEHLGHVSSRLQAALSCNRPGAAYAHAARREPYPGWFGQAWRLPDMRSLASHHLKRITAHMLA